MALPTSRALDGRMWTDLRMHGTHPKRNLRPSLMARTRQLAVDVTRTHDIAADLEQMLGPGFELVHTRRMGWMIRTYDRTRERVVLVEVDSAPEGSLGALLVRHQRRVRGEVEG
jgi:hypothetical protein